MRLRNRFNSGIRLIYLLDHEVHSSFFRICVQRLRTLQEKKHSIAKQSRREIATLIEKGKFETAKIKVENIINEVLPSFNLEVTRTLSFGVGHKRRNIGVARALLRASYRSLWTGGTGVGPSHCLHLDLSLTAPAVTRSLILPLRRASLLSSMPLREQR